jgi:hypothetical protein
MDEGGVGDHAGEEVDQSVVIEDTGSRLALEDDVSGFEIEQRQILTGPDLHGTIAAEDWTDPGEYQGHEQDGLLVIHETAWQQLACQFSAVPRAPVRPLREWESRDAPS